MNVQHRKNISGEGLPKHPQPFPTATKVGNMVFSSAIGGQDPATGKAPDETSGFAPRPPFRPVTIRDLAGKP